MPFLKSYEQTLSADRRLVILRILNELPSRCANSSVLYSLLAHWGHCPSRDLVKTELRWLQEQGLIEVSDIGASDILLAHLSERGVDIAAGRAWIDGVKRPISAYNSNNRGDVNIKHVTHHRTAHRTAPAPAPVANRASV